MKKFLMVAMVVAAIVGVACALGNCQKLLWYIAGIADIFFYPLIIIPLVICVSTIYILIKRKNKAVRALMSILLLAFLSFLALIIYPMFDARHPTPCYYLFENEANDVASRLADYFAVPTRTQLPSLDDLVTLTGYVLPENRDVIRKDDYVKESDIVVTLSGDVDTGIIIEITSKKGKCPMGEAYIRIVFGDQERGEWINGGTLR